MTTPPRLLRVWRLVAVRQEKLLPLHRPEAVVARSSVPAPTRQRHTAEDEAGACFPSAAVTAEKIASADSAKPTLLVLVISVCRQQHCTSAASRPHPLPVKSGLNEYPTSRNVRSSKTFAIVVCSIPIDAAEADRGAARGGQGGRRRRSDQCCFGMHHLTEIVLVQAEEAAASRPRRLGRRILQGLMPHLRLCKSRHERPLHVRDAETSESVIHTLRRQANDDSS